MKSNDNNINIESILNKTNKTTGFLYWLGLFMMLLGVISTGFTFFDINRSHQDTHYDTCLDNIPAAYKSISETKIVISDSELARQTVIQFIERLNQKADISPFLADTLERFYLEQNVSKKYVVKYTTNWTAHHPREHIIFNKDKFIVYSTSKGNIVYQNVSHSRDSIHYNPILLEIRVNSEYKIDYIRNYQATYTNTFVRDSIADTFMLFAPNPGILIRPVDAMR